MIMECLWRHKNELTIDIYHYLPNDALYLKKNIISNSNVVLQNSACLSCCHSYLLLDDILPFISVQQVRNRPPPSHPSDVMIKVEH